MTSSLLKNKKIVLFILFFILLVAFSFYFALIHYHEEYVFEVNEKLLQILADERVSHINTFLKFKEDEIKMLSSMDSFIELVKNPENESIINKSKRELEELKTIIPNIGILNSEGIVLVASQIPSGADFSNSQYFLSKNKSISFDRYYDPFRKDDFFGAISPIYDPDNISKIIGYVGFDIDLDNIAEILENSNLGDDAEIYLIDRQGLLLSKSKYLRSDMRNGVLVQEVKSDGATDCLNDLEKYYSEGEVLEHEENVYPYYNYMGDEVIGVHAYAPFIKGCVLAEKKLESMDKYSFTGYLINIFTGKEETYG